MHNYMHNFILIGASGYIAPRHMEAIKAVRGDLIACLDPHDSVGILDRYFPRCKYFRELERLDRHCELLLDDGIKIDYTVVCSPNYLHDSHSRFGLKVGSDVICEKPVVARERNLELLLTAEKKYCHKIHSVLQCRLHPAILELKGWANKQKERVQVKIDYNTPRGEWYHYSWKADTQKSGGLATNIGIHLFDICTWIWGNPLHMNIGFNDQYETHGHVALDRADIDYNLSLRGEPGKDSVRMIYIESNRETIKVDFTGGFEALHTEFYRSVLEGKSTGLEDIRWATRITEAIRDGTERNGKGNGLLCRGIGSNISWPNEDGLPII